MATFTRPEVIVDELLYIPEEPILKRVCEFRIDEEVFFILENDISKELMKCFEFADKVKSPLSKVFYTRDDQGITELIGNNLCRLWTV